MTRLHLSLLGCLACLFAANLDDRTVKAAESGSKIEPLISRLSPNSGLSGTMVIIYGSNLFQVTGIFFAGGTSAPIYGTVDDGTAVQTQVPADAITGQVVVVTAHGSATSPMDFNVVVAAPIIESFSPDSGSAGTSVTISGKNLVNVTSVQFNGVAASFQTMAGLSALVPTNATSGPITVTSKQGAFTTSGIFTVTRPGPPSISAFSPQIGPPGTTVTITGTNLVNVKSVSFNGVPAEFTTGFQPNQLYTTVPASAKTGLLEIQTESGSCTSKTAFTVAATGTPILTGFSTNSAKPGTWILLRGENLTLVRSVQFHGVEAQFSEIAPDALSANVPYAPSGLVTVVTEGGSATSAEIFMIAGGPAPPEIVGFFPDYGIDGTWVTIRVANLGTVRAVLFDGTEAEFKGEGDEIVAAVPSFASTGPISIETDRGTAVSAEAFQTFNRGELGVLNFVSSDSVVLGREITFTITLTNLSSSPVENINLTHLFASGYPPSDELVMWKDGGPVFQGVFPAHPKILDVSKTQGEHGVATGAVVWQVGRLEPGTSVKIRITVEARAPEIVHLLAAARGHRVDSQAAYASAVSSVIVTGAMELSVQLVKPEQIEISWALDPGLKLQRADHPIRTATWTDVTERVVVIDGYNLVRVPANTGAQFYRLVLRNLD